MDGKEIQEIITLEPRKGGGKQLFVTAILAPPIVVPVDVGPVYVVSTGVVLVPLHAGVQGFHHVIENFVGGYLCIRSAFSDGEVWFNVAVKIFA